MSDLVDVDQLREQLVALGGELLRYPDDELQEIAGDLLSSAIDLRSFTPTIRRRREDLEPIPEPWEDPQAGLDPDCCQ